VILNRRDLRIPTEISSVINDKEFAWAFISKDTFCVLSFIKKGDRIKGRYVDAGVVLGGRHDYVAET
jgi:hypothetical protein